MWFSALVMLVNLTLAATVGLRLLLRSRHSDQGPELFLAGYFLCGACLGTALSITVYSSLGDQGLDLGPALASRMLALSTLLSGVAAGCVYAFNWRTFRAEDTWAGVVVAAALALLAGSWVSQATTGGFKVVVMPGLAYWIERTVFCGAFFWTAVESLRYHAMLRRRLLIGLAEPIVANRFWLWGLWACATASLVLTDLGARVAYVWRTGETQVLHVEQAMPIIVVCVALSALIGALAAGLLYLTFFPARGYLGWIEARHATRG